MHGCGGTLYDGLYKVNLDNPYVETLKTLHHNVGIKRSLAMNILLTCGINI